MGTINRPHGTRTGALRGPNFAGPVRNLDVKESEAFKVFVPKLVVEEVIETQSWLACKAKGRIGATVGRVVVDAADRDRDKSQRMRWRGTTAKRIHKGFTRRAGHRGAVIGGVL